MISTNRKTQLSPCNEPSSPTINMCYNTGTFLSTLCNQPSFFSSITPFNTPKHISLGDDTTLVPALSKGNLDYIIDNKYCM